MMKGNFTGKGRGKQDADRAHGGGRESAAVPVPIDDCDSARLPDRLRWHRKSQPGWKRLCAIPPSFVPNSRKSARTAPTGSSTPWERSGTGRA